MSKWISFVNHLQQRGSVQQINGKWVAEFGTTDRWFKTIGGAQRFMFRNGYKIVEVHREVHLYE